MIVLATKPPSYSTLSQTVIDPQGFQATLNLTPKNLTVVVSKDHNLHKYNKEDDKISFYARILTIICEAIKEFSPQSHTFRSFSYYQHECVSYLTTNIPTQKYKEEAVMQFYANQYMPVSPLKIGALKQELNTVKNDYRELKSNITTEILSFKNFLASIKVPEVPEVPIIKTANAQTQTEIRNAWNYRSTHTQTPQPPKQSPIIKPTSVPVETQTQPEPSVKMVNRTVQTKKLKQPKKPKQPKQKPKQKTVRPSIYKYKLNKFIVKYKDFKKSFNRILGIRNKIMRMLQISDGAKEVFNHIDQLAQYDVVNYWCFNNALAVAKTQMTSSANFFVPDFHTFLEKELLPAFSVMKSEKIRLIINEWSDFQLSQIRTGYKVAPEELNIIITSYALRVSCSLNSENFKTTTSDILCSVSFSLPSFCVILCQTCGNMDKFYQIVGSYTVHKLKNELTNEVKKSLRNQALGLFMLKSPLAILYELKNKEDTWSKILF